MKPWNGISKSKKREVFENRQLRKQPGRWVVTNNAWQKRQGSHNRI